VLRRIAESGRALARVLRNADLRRLQLAWIGSIIGNWAYLVALAVYAYEQGGPAAVGLVWLIRLIPAAVAAPLLTPLADRFPRRHVMIGSDLARAGLMAAAAATIVTDGPAAVVYTLVAVANVVGVVFRPAQAALLPALARDPAELTAANVASSTVESVAMFAGPALGGLLLAATSPEVVFAVNGISFLWSAALVLGIHGETPAVAAAGPERSYEGLARRAWKQASAGVATIVRDRDLRVVVGLYAAQTLVAGALNVLVVVTAIELLDIGDAGVGYLNAAIGVGGLLGGFVVLTVASGGRLAAVFGTGVSLVGLPLVLIGVAPSVGVALIALGVIGLGNSLVDVGAITIMQRTVPDEVLARALGVLQGLLLGSMGIGAAVTPALVEAFGGESALVIVGLVLPLLCLLAAPRLRSLDRAARETAGLGLVRTVPLLAPLPEQTLERLAAQLGEVRLPAGATVLRAGEPGDRFYLVDSGEVEIEGRRFGHGESFGEIALLRDVPRTATVTALTDVVLKTIERDDFIAAVTGHAPAAAAADAVIAARIGALPDRVAPA
jgi:MFS family permease